MTGSTPSQYSRTGSLSPRSSRSAGPEQHSPEQSLAPGLHLVGVPIGNLGDISQRALATLAGASRVACEDTRVTGKLLAAHGIAANLTAYHEHNAARVRPKLVAAMAGGEAIALVADAGLPTIADPGYRLVGDCIAAGIAVTAVPGANAGLTALMLSGLPTDRFLYLGFLPPRGAARRAALAEIAGVRASLVIYEGPSRLADSLADMAEALGDRPAAVARELTKLHEELRRGPLSALADHYRAAGPPRGELVIVIGPPARTPADPDDPAVIARLTALLAAGLGVKEAASRAAGETGLPRRALYQRAQQLKENTP